MSAPDIGSGPPGRFTERLEPKELRRWLKPRVSAAQRNRLAPPRPKLQRLGAADFWRRARNAFWAWWLWLLLAAFLLYRGHHIAPVLIAVIAVFMYHAAPLPHPAVYAMETHLDANTEEFRTTMEGATGMPLATGNAVTIYNNGDTFYPAMLEAIEAAGNSVTMEQYIFWDGRVGRRFAEAFAEKARSGVPVKLLVDAIGSSILGEKNLKTLEAGGCQLAWFRPVHWYTLDRANRRTHRKSLIVDGRIAFTGGAGLADPWLGSAANERQWRDVQIRVEGPAALAQQAGFAQNWLRTTGEILSGHAYFQLPAEAGTVAVQTILSSPWDGASAAETMYLIALQSARKRLCIANPYFVPDARVIEMLAQASGRGVRIQLLVSGRRSDSWWARNNGVRLYGRLLRAGVEIHEFEPTMLHQKIMVVDGAWATVGTANFDNRSFAWNEETNVCFHDPGLVAELEAAFVADLARSHKVEIEAWRRRGLWQQAAEVAASLLEDQV